MTTVRGALIQATWTGDKASMIDKHEEYTRQAADEGAQVMCYQELFYGPYFCQVHDKEYFGLTEQIPDGPTTERFQNLAQELGMVLIVPMYEEDGPGISTTPQQSLTRMARTWANTAKRTSQTSPDFGKKYYFRPGNLGYPVFDTAVGRVGVYICYDRHFPEGAPDAGPQRCGDCLHSLCHLARAFAASLEN